MFPRNCLKVGRRGIILAVLITTMVAGHVVAKVDKATRLLERSVSLMGPTGWLNIPTAAVPGNGRLSAGIHLNNATLNLGVFDFLEAGIFFKADQLGHLFEPYRNLSRWDLIERNIPGFARETFYGHAKLKIIDQDWGMLNLACGIENQDPYVVVHRFMPGLSRVTVVGGWGRGRFSKGFGGFSKTLFPGAQVMLEYDGQGMNFGFCFLLATNLVFNVAGRNLETVGEVDNLGEVITKHFMFGITYVERWW